MSFLKRLLKRKSLWKRVTELESDVAELKKKKISDRTQEEDEQASYSQIVNEWMNGEENE